MKLNDKHLFGEIQYTGKYIVIFMEISNDYF